MRSLSGWRGTLVLIILLVITVQGLLKVLTPILPWVVIGLAALAVIAGVALAVIRRGTRW